MFEDVFSRKRPNTDKLLSYGFEQKESCLVYETQIMDNDFVLKVFISKSGDVDTELIESETNEPYCLYKTNASGSYVGEVRNEIEKILKSISDNCYEQDVFKTEQSKQIIKYVRDTYGDELEFLWSKFPDNAVWRRKDSNKWYAAILTVAKSKLGLPSDEIAEIIDLRFPKDEITQIVDNKHYFPGWHMNKKSWYTIVLDNSVPSEEICSKIDESYKLAHT